MSSVKVSIGGKSFSVSTDDDESRIKGLAKKLNEKITEFMGVSKVQYSDAVSLVALMLIDDLDNSQKKVDFLRRKFVEVQESYNEKVASLEESYNEKVASLEESYNEKVASLEESYKVLSASPEEVKTLREKVKTIEEKARLELLESVSLEYKE